MVQDDWDKQEKTFLKNPEYRKALKETELEYQVARQLILARTKKRMTQTTLAKKMGTKQSVISRVENAQTKPTLSFLERLARALDTSLNISFGT